MSSYTYRSCVIFFFDDICPSVIPVAFTRTFSIVIKVLKTLHYISKSKPVVLSEVGNSFQPKCSVFQVFFMTMVKVLVYAVDNIKCTSFIWSSHCNMELGKLIWSLLNKEAGCCCGLL